MPALLLALLAVPVGRASAEPASPPSCPLDPALTEMREACEAGTGETRSRCLTLNLLRALAIGDRETGAEILARDLELPRASTDRLLPWLEVFAALAVDPDGEEGDCGRQQYSNLMTLLGGGLLSGEPHAEPLLVLLRVGGFPDDLVAPIEARLEAGSAAAVGELAEDVGAVLRSTELGALLAQGLRGMVGDVLAGKLPEMNEEADTEAPPDLVPEAADAIDRAIRLSQQGRLEEGSKAVTTALATVEDDLGKSKLLIRAAVGFLLSGHVERSLELLHQADSLLEERAAADPEAAAARAVAGWFLGFGYHELDREPPGPAPPAASMPVALQEFLESVGPAIVAGDLAAAGSALRALEGKVADGELTGSDLEPLMTVFEDTIPWIDRAQFGGETGGRGYLEGLLEFISRLDRQDLDGAGEVVEELLTRYPRYNNVYYQLVLAARHWIVGDPERAVAYCERALGRLGGGVESFRVDDLQTSFVADKIAPAFRFCVEVAAGAGLAEKSFEFGESLRAWTLRRLLGGPRSRERSSVAGRADPQLEEIRGLERRLREIEARIGRLEGPSPAATAERERVRSALDERRGDYVGRRIVEKLGVAGAEGLAEVAPPTVERLRSEILTPDTTLLVYGAGIGGWWAWVVDREAIDVVRLEVEGGWRRFEPLARSLRDRRIGRGAQPAFGSAGEEGSAADLYTGLLAPLVHRLDPESRPNLIVVPQGPLHHVPFAALRDPETGRYLMEDFTISLAPSASALELLLRPAPAGTGGPPLVLGNPVSHLGPLPGAEGEARVIGELLGTEPLVGVGATEARVHARAGRVGLLHLAAHAEYVPEHAIFSRILLGPGDGHDGRLEVHEVWDHLDLGGTSVVTLSGCETALGELTRGDEVIGLTQAFLVAGSRAVLSTLWKVDDTASQALMEAFYRRLIGGAPAALALREAQRQLRESERWSSPYYWAGYTLTGDPRVRWHPAGGSSGSVGRRAPVTGSRAMGADDGRSVGTRSDGEDDARDSASRDRTPGAAGGRLCRGRGGGSDALGAVRPSRSSGPLRRAAHAHRQWR